MKQNQQVEQWTQYIETERSFSPPEKLDSILEKRLQAFIAARLSVMSREKARL